MIFHPSQSLFLGTFSMGFSTIINMCALSAAPAWGHGMVIFTWTLWWINVPLTLLIAIGVPFIQVSVKAQSLRASLFSHLLTLSNFSVHETRTKVSQHHRRLASPCCLSNRLGRLRRYRRRSPTRASRPFDPNNLVHALGNWVSSGVLDHGSILRSSCYLQDSTVSDFNPIES